MKNDRSQKDIVKIYEYFGNRLSTISFDPETGNRKLTYSGLSLYTAMADKLWREQLGQRVYIICGRPELCKGEGRDWENDEHKVKDFSRYSFSKPFYKMVNKKHWLYPA